MRITVGGMIKKLQAFDRNLSVVMETELGLSYIEEPTIITENVTQSRREKLVVIKPE